MEQHNRLIAFHQALYEKVFTQRRDAQQELLNARSWKKTKNDLRKSGQTVVKKSRSWRIGNKRNPKEYKI